MSLHVTFRKLKGTDALKTHIEKKVAKFEKFVTYPMEIHVLMSVEKPFHTAEVTLHAEHRDIVGIAKSKDLYESIDLVVHKVENQLKKEREKKKGHKSARALARPSALKLATDVEADIPHREKNHEKKLAE